jgi:hypothetical protein
MYVCICTFIDTLICGWTSRSLSCLIPGVHTHAYVCVCVCVCVEIVKCRSCLLYACMYAHVCWYVCMHQCIWVCSCLEDCRVWSWVCMHAFIRYMYAYVCVCVSMYVLHTHIHIHTMTHTQDLHKIHIHSHEYIQHTQGSEIFLNGVEKFLKEIP